MHSFFYLDTSGLNFFADKVGNSPLISDLKKHLGFELYLSPINLWEVLLNSDDKRKDYLIYWAQFNCADRILKSPTETIIQHITLGCPLKDKRVFFDNPFTEMEIGETWNNIHGRIDRTIPIDLNALKERSAAIRMLSKNLRVIINDMCDRDNENYSKDPFQDIMKQTLKKLDRSLDISIKDERIFKITLIFTLFVVCIGFELQNKVVRDFWEPIKIEDPFERLDYLIDKYPILMVRGPLLEMAMMADVQLSMANSKSRGLLHDCFHAVYCYYTHNIITGDSHFASLKEQFNNSTFEGIIMTQQVQELWEKTIEILK